MLEAEAMGAALANAITDPSASTDAKAVVLDWQTKWSNAFINYFLANVEINTPPSQVIVAVKGQATGTPNPSPIKCTVQ